MWGWSKRVHSGPTLAHAVDRLSLLLLLDVDRGWYSLLSSAGTTAVSILACHVPGCVFQLSP